MNEQIIEPQEGLDETEKRLIALVEEHREELIQLLKDLIKFDSRTYDSEHFSDLHPITKFCQHKFMERGISTKIVECPHMHQDGAKELSWPNLIASLPGKIRKGEENRRLGFMGHLDIVPFSSENWTAINDPLQPEIKKGKLYGRGAIDMKSGVAAQMMAMFLLKKSGIEFNGELQMILTPDEEISGKYGAAFLASEHPEIAAAAGRIISEPTGQPPIKSPAIIIGEKGANWLRLHFHGASGHGSQPKPKSNAINKAARFIFLANKYLKFHDPKPPFTFKDLAQGMISRYGMKNLLGSMLKPTSKKEKQKDSKQNEITDGKDYNEDGLNFSTYFHTSVSFNQIQAGTKTNIIPDSCTLEIDIRALPGMTLRQILQDIADYANNLGFRVELGANLSKNYSIEQKKKVLKRNVDITIEMLVHNEGGSESMGSELAQLLTVQFEKIYRTRHLFFLSPGMTDASHFRKHGIRNIVVFGPSGDNAHNADEFVYLEDLIQCTKVYLTTAYRFLKKQINISRNR